MHRRLLSAAATSTLLLGLSACSEPTDGPVTTPPPNIDIGAPSDGGGDAEPSDGDGEKTAEPTAEAPDIPPPDPADYAGKDEHTAEGAEQAFKYYIAVSVWAHQTGDDSILGDLEADDCGGCEYLNSDIPKAKDSKLLWTDSSISDSELSSIEASVYEREVRYKFVLAPHSRADTDFQEYIEVEELKYDSVGGMNWNSDSWQVDGMSIEWGDDVF